MFAAGDSADAVVAAAGAMVVILIVWLVLHHSRPELKVDIGVRGWVNLIRPPKQPDPPDDPPDPDTPRE